MGHVPDWARGSQAKTGSSKPQQGVRSVELFHNAPSRNVPSVRKFAEGGEVELNVNGDKVGSYSGDDEIVKYRMNQIDDKGNDLRIPESAKTTQSQMNVQDMEGSSAKDATPPAKTESATTSSPAAKPARVSSSKPSTVEAGPSADDRLRSKYGRPDYQAIAQDQQEGYASAPVKQKATTADARNVIFGSGAGESFESKLNKLNKRK